MPNRYVRENAIRSKSVNSLSWQAEVFWRRLLNLVDDFGRFHADHELLLSDVFPRQKDRVREADIPRLLAECEKAGLLFRFEADSKPFLVLNQWETGRAKSSKYPAPPEAIRQQMQTHAYSGLQMSPTTTTTTTLTPTPNSEHSQVLTSKPSVKGDARGKQPAGWTPFRPATARELEIIALCEEVMNGQWADNSTFWGNRIMGSERITAEPDKVDRVMRAVQDEDRNGKIKTTKAQFAMHCWKTFK